MVKKANSSNTLTDESIITSMEQFIRSNPYGNTYVMTFSDEGVISLHERLTRPCYGEMRPYDRKSDGYPKPSDLTKPFPKSGNPVGVSISLSNVDKRFLKEFILNPTVSPWRDMMIGDSMRVIGEYQGVTFLNTKVNADLLANFCISLRGLTFHENFFRLTDLGVSPHIAMVWCIQYPLLTQRNYYKSHDHYWILDDLDPKRLRDANPFYLESPFDWYDRSAYHRPTIHHLWSGPDAMNLGEAIFSGKDSVTLKDAVSSVNEYTAARGLV